MAQPEMVHGNYSDAFGKRLFRDASIIAQAKSPQRWFDVNRIIETPTQQAVAVHEALVHMEKTMSVTLYERGH